MSKNLEGRELRFEPLADIPATGPRYRLRQARRGESRTVNWLAAMIAVYLAKQIFGIEITQDGLQELLTYLTGDGNLDKLIDGLIVLAGGGAGIYFRVKAKNRLSW